MRACAPLAVIVALALPAAAQEARAFACTGDDGPLRLLIGAGGALVTRAQGQEIGFDRPVTRRDNGPVVAFAAVTPLDTTLLLTLDRTSPESTGSRLMITEHGRDADGPRITSLTATCRPEGG